MAMKHVLYVTELGLLSTLTSDTQVQHGPRSLNPSAVELMVVATDTNASKLCIEDFKVASDERNSPAGQRGGNRQEGCSRNLGSP